MTLFDTHPTSPDVLDQIVQILDELEDAGGELVITRNPAPDAARWSVQVLTDVVGPGEPCEHEGSADRTYLADAINASLAQLQADQDHAGVAAR